MTRITLFGLFAALLICICACVPPKDKSGATVVNTDLFADAQIQEIYRLQDLRNTDSLLSYFEDQDASYRYAAALAFGSVRDSNAVEPLGALLKDESMDVRYAAAYALGQIGHASAEPLLLEGFERYDSTGAAMKVNATILEAIGKCGSLKSLQQMSKVSTYKAGDTLLQEGLAWAVYRFGLRSINDTAATARMVDLVNNKRNWPRLRLIAAHYLGRAKGIRLDTFARALAPLAVKESDVNIRMALASALSKSVRPYVADTLMKWLPRETDYRVRVNIINALATHNYKYIRPAVFNALKDPNVHVQNTAARFFVGAGQGMDATYYWRLAKDSTLTWVQQAALYAAAQKHLPVSFAQYRDAMNFQCRKRYERATDPYEKAAFLKALGEFGWNFRYIYQQGTAAKSTTLRTAAWEALSTINERPDFFKFFGAGWPKVAKELSIYFKRGTLGGDAGVMALAAIALRTPQRAYREFFPQYGWLDTALTTLKMPRDLETYHEIQKTIAYLKNTEPAILYKNKAANNSVNWSVLQSLDQDTRTIIQTSKGSIRVQLLPNLAPASVASFVDLAKNGYYNNKTFHRVVPNFVVQGGCPRGDGYGSLDFTLRTEVPPASKYSEEGYIGLASAGADTEGVQFFIVHSPTPHLDGKYTIFAKVIEGMNVVHDIQVGDLIKRITVQ
jgi:cyclophilin family peptidyl-prolyl cis-trans isomerase/HEAT repeat protein